MVNGKEQVKEKVFNDAVHGAISLHPLCVKVIDTLQFQRLRFLKQLGSTYFVYPSAAHNRFEHSIGVSYLAGQWASALRSWQPELGITDEEVLCVQLAGLCHDLGHGPFSHLWEQFVKEAGHSWQHENASVEMFEYLYKQNKLQQEFEKYGLTDEHKEFIKELIGGSRSFTGSWLNEERRNEKAFLYEIVANQRTGIDVDKWDYFLRDSHNLGIKVTFDYHRIIKFSRVLQVDGKGLQICVRDKESDNLYEMFHTRRNLHRKAYQHRVVKTIDTMILDALKLADKHIKYRGADGKLYCLSEVCNDMAAFTNLTDEVFQRIRMDEGTDPALLEAKELLDRILTRQLYLYVGQSQPVTSEDKITKEKLQEALESCIPEGSSLTRDQLEIQEVKFSYGKGDRNPLKKVHFYTKNAPNTPKVLRKEQISKMLPDSFQEVFFRLVCRTNDEAAFREAQQAFKLACAELEMREPSVDAWPSHLTPVKEEGQTSPVGYSSATRSLDMTD